MSNFNQYFRKKGAKIIVDRFFTKVDEFHTNKISSMDFKFIEEAPRPTSYYIENSLTAVHRVQIEYTLNGEPEVYYSEFEVPKEIDGVFIIEGSYRIASNELGSDYDCRIRMSGSGDYRINFDYDRYYDINKQVLRIKKPDPIYGLPERGVDIKYSDIDSWLQDPLKKELLLLTDRQKKKWAVKLDLDWTPEYINTRLIDAALAFGDDRVRDLVVDKTIESVPTAFFKFLFRNNNGRNYFKARRLINSYFTKYGKLQDQLTAINTLCLRFFKGSANEKTAELQVPPGINSQALQSLSSKIQVPNSVAINTSMLDLIDLTDTPINQNINLQNSLTVSTHVTDEDILFDVFTPEFTKITLSYLDYLNKKVVSSDYVDYDNKKLLPNENGEVEVKYRMKRKMVPVTEIDLVDLHPDYRLSTATRRIPFCNYTDSVRVSMGSAMLKQAIPLIHAERPLVDTGNYEELHNNVLNELFKYEKGKVKDITADKVIIELDNGTEVDYIRQTAIKSHNDVAVWLEPKVKIGQRVKRGDVITGAVGHEEDTYKAGVNTLVMYGPHFGLTNEDALVISSSYADRIASYSIIDVNFEIRNTSALKWIAPIGTKVKSGDALCIQNKAVRLDDINRALTTALGGMIGEDVKTTLSEYTIEDTMVVPNNIDDAIVSDVMVQYNAKPYIPKTIKAPDFRYSLTSKSVIEEYEKNKSRKVIYDKYPEYVAADTLDPINLDQYTYKTVYLVRVRLIKYGAAVVGEKITSRYGGKGVVSLIVPDADMPLVVDPTSGEKKRVEVIMNPYSTINRKIPSVIMECGLGLIAHRLRDLVEEYKKTKTGQKKILPLLEKYYPGRFSGMTVEEVIEKHNKLPIQEVYYFNVGSFSKFTPSQISDWMSELGVESQSKVLMPQKDLIDMDELKANLSEEEYNKLASSISGKFAEVDKPLMVGYMTLERLYHIPSYSNKVTTSLYGVDVNPRKSDPIFAGRGKYRVEGQKIGEMDTAAIISRAGYKFLEKTRESTSREDNQIFLNNLLGLGLTVTDSKGYNQGGSNLKDQLSKMKTKFRLKNNK